MLDEFFAIGGIEVGNNARAIGYQRSMECGVHWIDDDDYCRTIGDALGDQPYTWDSIEEAPWFDEDVPDLSRGFLGVYVLGVSGLEDSTLGADVIERTRGGGVIGRQRYSTRQMAFRLHLTALTEESLDYGMSWLSAVVSGRACGVHGGSCGLSDLQMFVSCPPPSPAGGSPTDHLDYLEAVNDRRRFFHDVGCTSGVRVVQSLKSSVGAHVGRVVEFILTAENPRVYTMPREVSVPPSTPQVVQDVVYNLSPTPSAELAGAAMVVSTNYATNPSVEVDATGWGGAGAAVSGESVSGLVTSGRVTELAANGSASFRTRLLGAGSGLGLVNTALLSAYHDVPVSGLSGNQMSCSMWGAVLVTSGTSDIEQLDCVITWLSSTGGELSTTTVEVADPSDYAGHAFRAERLDIPAGSTVARVTIRARVKWSSSATPASNSDIRLYADAVALAIP